MKNKFFTGHSCSGCKVIKALIEERGKAEDYEVIYVEDNPLEARKHAVRSLPTIVTKAGEYLIGVANCNAFVNT